jgi:uncharacterized protein YeeX (DUF496 family)
MSDEKKITEPKITYQDVVKEEISFARATGYDKEMTSVVPLAELARREEKRLRRVAAGEEEKREVEDKSQRVIPVGEIIDVLRAARSVEEVAGVLVEIVANLLPRVLLLWERNAMLYGFASRGMGLKEVKLLTIEMPKSVLVGMTASDLELESHIGPPCNTEQVRRLFDIIGGNPPEVLLIPVYVTPVDRWVLYADNQDAPLPTLEIRLLEVIVSRAGARADLLMDGKIW